MNRVCKPNYYFSIFIYMGANPGHPKATSGIVKDSLGKFGSQRFSLFRRRLLTSCIALPINYYPKIYTQIMLNRREVIEGCLLGCAVGDSVCLPYEGISPRRLSKWLQLPLRHRFLFGRGMVSDDTDHSLFVAQALAIAPNDPERFARLLAWRLRFWLLCLPAGIGLATLKSILRLWLGASPSRSGVFSAGNGAAMRSAIIGVIHCDDTDLRHRFSKASSVITHSDPKAQYGAQSVADLAAFLTRNGSRPTVHQLERLLLDVGEGEEWEEAVLRTIDACQSGVIQQAVTTNGLKLGVSGYILHTLPVAVAAWYINFGDFRMTIEAVVRLGGDTDTVAAIA
jgi:ADP-ribosyl-[dinitrogen reductase] hydrolase